MTEITPTMSSQIIEILDNLAQKFGIAIDWTGQNVIPYVQELTKKIVNYELWTSVAWISLFVIGMILCFFIAWIMTKTKDFDWSNVEYEVIPTIACVLNICGICLSIFLVIVVTFQIFDIITCLTFPEKIILDYISLIINTQ